jgi:hypothetical protein
MDNARRNREVATSQPLDEYEVYWSFKGIGFWQLVPRLFCNFREAKEFIIRELRAYDYQLKKLYAPVDLPSWAGWTYKKERIIQQRVTKLSKNRLTVPDFLKPERQKQYQEELLAALAAENRTARAPEHVRHDTRTGTDKAH